MGAMDTTDEQLFIARAKQGDETAYEQLLAKLILPAHKLACGLLHDSYLAEDAVQEAAVKVWRKIRNLTPGAFASALVSADCCQPMPRPSALRIKVE